ncbi:Peptidase M16 inactive domain-containing protein [Sinosporangium album]|uniref:Peptidase M16 inactive domain-containing protein n=2 Tax=Sinosporangium album TaxID=504805 RepID=A0A1G7SH08_9ACTN|nr:Peptidase M16 inactive domain-containing protein [Sinosporangium album]
MMSRERAPSGVVVAALDPEDLPTAVVAATLVVPLRGLSRSTVLAAPLVADLWAATVAEAAMRAGAEVAVSPVAAVDFAGVTVEAVRARWADVHGLPYWFSPTALPTALPAGDAVTRARRTALERAERDEGRWSDRIRAALFGGHRYGVGHAERIAYLRACGTGDLLRAMGELAAAPPVLAMSAADGRTAAECAAALSAAIATRPSVPPSEGGSALSSEGVSVPPSALLSEGPSVSSLAGPIVEGPDSTAAGPSSRGHYLVGAKGVALGDEEKFALHIAWAVLGGREGELDRRLRHEDALTYSLAAFSREFAEGGYGLIYGACRADALEVVTERVEETLEWLASAGPTAAMVDSAKERLIIRQMQAVQSARGFTERMCGYEIAGISAGRILDYPERLERVHAAQVVEAASRFLGSDVRIIG